MEIENEAGEADELGLGRIKWVSGLAAIVAWKQRQQITAKTAKN